MTPIIEGYRVFIAGFDVGDKIDAMANYPAEAGAIAAKFALVPLPAPKPDVDFTSAEKANPAGVAAAKAAAATAIAEREATLAADRVKAEEETAAKEPK